MNAEETSAGGPFAVFATLLPRGGFANLTVSAHGARRVVVAEGGRLLDIRVRERRCDEHPYTRTALERLLALEAMSPGGDVRPDASCWFGYVGYEAGATLAEAVPPRPAAAGDLPELWLAQFEDVVCGASVEEATSRAVLRESDDGGAAFLTACRELGRGAPPERDDAPPPTLAEFGGYARAIERTRAYILGGDIYQANITRRLTAGEGGDAVPRALFDALARTSPSTHAVLLDLGGGDAIVGSSSEVYLRWRADGLLETRPIKGTARIRDGEAAGATAAALRASEKDRAEHVMIVDVERNDLGRLCEVGSVAVESLAHTLELPRLVHLESTVVGRPRADVTPLDATLALFPGGSVTGAPKLRAMEIIRELEPVRRNVYTGIVGWIGARSMHWNVAIRTLYRVAGGPWQYHVGGGIVADSTSEAEWEETETKALGMEAALRAAAAARGGRRTE